MSSLGFDAIIMFMGNHEFHGFINNAESLPNHQCRFIMHANFMVDGLVYFKQGLFNTMSLNLFAHSDDNLPQIVLPPDYNSSSSSVGDFDFDFDFDEVRWDGIHSIMSGGKWNMRQIVLPAGYRSQIPTTFKQMWERVNVEAQMFELVCAAMWVHAQRSHQPLPPFPRHMQLEFSPLQLKRFLRGCVPATARTLVAPPAGMYADQTTTRCCMRRIFVRVMSGFVKRAEVRRQGNAGSALRSLAYLLQPLAS